MEQRVLYPLNEAQELLGGVSRDLFYRLERRGEIRLVRIGRRVFVPADEIDRLTEQKSDE